MRRITKEHLYKFKSCMPGTTEWHGYSCNFCGTMYKTHQDAEHCFKQGFKPRLSPGDIVARRYSLEHGKGEYGWYNGEDEWLLFDGKADDTQDKTGLAFYYVVTKVMSCFELKANEAPRGDHSPHLRCPYASHQRRQRRRAHDWLD